MPGLVLYDNPASSNAQAILRRALGYSPATGGRGAVLGRFTIADCALAPVLYRTTHTASTPGRTPACTPCARRSSHARPSWPPSPSGNAAGVG